MFVPVGAMPLTVLYSISILVVATSGHVILESHPTSPAEDIPDGVHGWTPKPTQAPQLLNEPPLAKGDLRKRSGVVSGCGYYDENPNSPFLCGPGSNCTHEPDHISIRGDCADNIQVTFV